MSYKPPINAELYEIDLSMLNKEFLDAVTNDVDHYIFCAFERVFGIHNIKVDEEELKKALNYDREQYYKGHQDGYQEGYNDKEKEIIHCKDCKYQNDIIVGGCKHIKGLPYTSPNDFCSYGERRGKQND